MLNNKAVEGIEIRYERLICAIIFILAVIIGVWIRFAHIGDNDLALRFIPAMFGTLTVLMVWLLRKHLGAVGTPVAAFLMALSPGLVYFSRDFIHEMSFGCFSLGIVVGAWRYAESKNFTWLALTATSAGLLFATKETAIITAVVMIIAALCAAALAVI